MELEILGQILGFVATALTFASYQFNTKRSLLFVQTAATMANCLAYFCLGGGTGFVLNIVCIGRNLIYYFQESGTRTNRITALLLSLAVVATGAFSWNGPISLLIIIALAINTFILSLGKPQVLRKSILLTCSMIIIYNASIGAYGSILNECVAIVSSVVGILRFRKEAAEQDAENA
ncbi:MAG: YgjV family protein [Muribaculaceae bacterium]|nr:YgjV family protein [Muribaculaceae bacterium]